jgi:hypothetical protein
MIQWHRESTREDRDPARYDATIDGLHLRVIEREHDNGRLYYVWGVSETEHPFEDEIADGPLAFGIRASSSSAKDACRIAARKARP